MKKNSNKVSAKLIILGMTLVLALGLMAGCGNKTDGGADGTNVADPKLTPSEMLEKVVANAPDVKDSLMDLTEEQMVDFFGFTDDVKFEGAVKMSSMNVKANEIGIFKMAKAEDGTGIQMAIDNRINNAIAGWMPGYMPEEIAKMENATVKNIGNYYIYVIADDASKAAILKDFEALFK